MYLGYDSTSIYLFNPPLLDDILIKGNARIFSNSWGDKIDNPGWRYYFDSAVYNLSSGENCLYVFCAGNEGLISPYYSLMNQEHVKIFLQLHGQKDNLIIKGSKYQ